MNIIKKLKNHKVAVIDIETTGKDPSHDSILEIGIVELDLTNGTTNMLMDSLVKEPIFGSNHKEAWIFNNSDLKFENFENVPMFEDLKQKINEILNKYPITAFNKDFDFKFLRSRGIYIPKELPCIMEKAQNILKIPSKYYAAQYKKPNFQETYKFFFPNSKYIEKHRALDDAIHEAKVLFELCRRGYY